MTTRFRLDYDVTSHPKIKALSKGAAWAYVQSVLYCNHFGVDTVPRDVVLSMVPGPGDGTYKQLIDTGFWTIMPAGGVAVADPIAFCSKETKTRAQTAERQRRFKERHRVTSNAVARNNTGPSVTFGVTGNVSSNAKSNAESNGEGVISNAFARSHAGGRASPVLGVAKATLENNKTTTATSARARENGSRPHEPPPPPFDPLIYEHTLGEENLTRFASALAAKAGDQFDEKWLRAALRDAARATGEARTGRELAAALGQARASIEQRVRIKPGEAGYLHSPRPWAKALILAKIRGDE